MESQRTHEHRKAATRAGLKYVTDGFAGISRRRAGSGWIYFAPNGARIRDADKRQRLNKLAIPPAWTDVWICPDPRRAHPGHGARRARAQAVPLPLRRIARRATAPSSATCSSSARSCRSCASASSATCSRGAHARPGARDGGAPARPHAHPRRQRRVRAREPLLRPHDAAPAARRGERRRRCASASAARAASSTTSRSPTRRLAKIIQRCQELPGQELFQYRRRGAASARRSPPTT